MVMMLDLRFSSSTTYFRFFVFFVRSIPIIPLREIFDGLRVFLCDNRQIATLARIQVFLGRFSLFWSSLTLMVLLCVTCLLVLF